MMTFHIGQQVVCVDDNFSQGAVTEVWRRNVQSLPKLHSIYTVRETCEGGGLIGLYFYEIQNLPGWFPRDGWGEACFDSRRFRPVKKTNIDIFLKLLAPTETELIEA